MPADGSGNTVHSSKYSLKKNYNTTSIESTHGSNYKQLMQLNSDPKKEKNLWNFDTGMNGNPFQGNYFTFNKKHLAGELFEMKIGRQLEGTNTKTLTLIPENKRSSYSGQEEL